MLKYKNRDIEDDSRFLAMLQKSGSGVDAFEGSKHVKATKVETKSSDASGYDFEGGFRKSRKNLAEMNDYFYKLELKFEGVKADENTVLEARKEEFLLSNELM